MYSGSSECAGERAAAPPCGGRAPARAGAEASLLSAENAEPPVALRPEEAALAERPGTASLRPVATKKAGS